MAGAADTLRERLRLGLWVVIAFSALFMIADARSARASVALLLGLHSLQAVTAAVALAVLRRSVAERSAVLIALIVVAVVGGATAAAGIVTGDSVTTRGVCVLVPLATATMLQWGVRPQLAVVSCALAAIAWNVHHTMGGLAALANHPAILVGVAASVYIAYAFARLARAEGNAAAALRASEESFRSAVANMQDVLFRNDVNAVIRYISPSVQQFGYTPEELIGTDASRLYVCADEQQRVRAAVLAHGSVTDFEIVLRRKDGTPVTVSASSHLMADGDGRVTGFEGVLRDITPRKHAEAALRDSEERFRALVQNASDGICVVDVTGIIRYASPSMTALMGFTPAELIGSVAAQYLHPDDLSALFSGFAAAPPGTPSRFEHRVRHKTGTWVDVETTGTVLLDVPVIAGTVLNVRDISDRKRLDAQRADFVAMLVHDIRNPLSVISGYTDLLLDTAGLPHETHDMLAACEQSVQSLMSLVVNYLQQSQIDAGQLTLDRQPVALHELLQRLHRRYKEIGAAHRIALELRVAPGLPVLDADPVALERVFTNLLQNALKFTPDGGRIVVEAHQQGGDLAVSVADTGPGIAPEELAELFARYRRARTGRSQPGTGLGLFIVKALVEAHGGRVTVTSTLAAGSRFTVVLPRRTPVNLGQPRSE